MVVKLMRRSGSRPEMSPDDLLRIGRLFTSGMDTKAIASQMRLPEHAVANSLGLARAVLKAEKARKPEESPL